MLVYVEVWHVWGKVLGSMLLLTQPEQGAGLEDPFQSKKFCNSCAVNEV